MKSFPPSYFFAASFKALAKADEFRAEIREDQSAHAQVVIGNVVASCERHAVSMFDAFRSQIDHKRDRLNHRRRMANWKAIHSGAKA